MNEPRKGTIEVGISRVKMIDLYGDVIIGYEKKKVIKSCEECAKTGEKFTEDTPNYRCSHKIKLTGKNGKRLLVWKELPITENKYKGTVKMNAGDVLSYFKKIRPNPPVKKEKMSMEKFKALHDAYLKQTYCNRCGIIIGPDKYYTYADIVIIQRESGMGLPLEVCPGCYDDKVIKKVKEAIPDIEDIVRFEIDL